MNAQFRDTGRHWGPLLAATMLLHPACLSLALEAPALLAGALLFGWASCGGEKSGEGRRVAVAGFGVALVALQSCFAAAVLIVVPLLCALQERQPGALRRAMLVALPGFVCAAMMAPQSSAGLMALESRDLSYWLASPVLFAPCALIFRIRPALRTLPVRSARWRGGLALWLAALVAIAAGTGGWSAAGLLAPWMAFAFGPSARSPHLQSLFTSSIAVLGALMLVTGAVPVTPAAQAHATYVVPVERLRSHQVLVPTRFWRPDPLDAANDGSPLAQAASGPHPRDDFAGLANALDPIDPAADHLQPVRLAAAAAPVLTGERVGILRTGLLNDETETEGSYDALKTVLALTLGTGPEWIPDLAFRRFDGLEDVSARAPLAALTVWSKYELSAGIALAEDVYVQAWGARVTSGPFGDDSMEAGLTATIRF